MFTAPPEATLEWNDSAVEGSRRFLNRVWSFGAALWADGSSTAEKTESPAAAAGSTGLSPAAKDLRFEIHTVLGQINHDYERMQYNTVVSGAMKMLNALEAFKPGADAGDPAARAEGFSILLRVLYPVTPHICWALWHDLGFAATHGDLLDAPWPQVDETALQRDTVDLVLQINGKLRGSITVPADAGRDAIEQAALASDAFAASARQAACARPSSCRAGSSTSS